MQLNGALMTIWEREDYAMNSELSLWLATQGHRMLVQRPEAFELRLTMKRFWCFIVIVMCSLAIEPAYSLSGNEYRRLTEVQKLAWTVGVLEGILAVQVIEGRKHPELVECLKDLEREQIRAIFEKVLENDPERWHFPASYSFYFAFRTYCQLD